MLWVSYWSVKGPELVNTRSKVLLLFWVTYHDQMNYCNIYMMVIQQFSMYFSMQIAMNEFSHRILALFSGSKKGLLMWNFINDDTGKGLIIAHKMTCSQLACWLNWYSTPPASQTSGFESPFRPFLLLRKQH